MKKIIGMIFLGLISFQANAAGGIVGQIQAIDIKETGYVLVTLTSIHSNPDNCQNTNAVVFEPAHAAKKEMLSVSLAAMTSQKQSSFYLNGCYSAYGSTFPIAITAAIKN